MQTRAPIKKPFALTCWASGWRAKGFSKQRTVNSEIIPDFPELSNMVDRAAMVAGGAGINGASVYFPLDHGAGCRYSHHTQTVTAASRRLKPAFFIPHIQKFFCVKCRVAVRPRRPLQALVTLGAFLFLGGQTMQNPFQNPTTQGFSPIITEQQETKQAKVQAQSRAFCTWFDNPADILSNAESIVQFLEEVCPAMIDDGCNLGLSKNGMNGLAIIYQALGETIRAALEGIAAESQAETAKKVMS